MTDLDLDSLAAVAEAADINPRWMSVEHPSLMGQARAELTLETRDHIATFDPSTVLALIAEVRDARAEAISENAQMLTVQDELNEALDSICEHKAAMTDMRRRKEAAEADLERLRGEVAALAEAWGKPGNHPVLREIAAERLRALNGGER